MIIRTAILLCIVSTQRSTGSIDKRLELDGIYRIQSPEDYSVIAIGYEESGNPPLKRVVTERLVEGPSGIRQRWRITTYGPLNNRVAAIFNEFEGNNHNTLTHEFGFPGSSFVRVWQILDIGDDLAVLRSFGRCLTRFPEPPEAYSTFSISSVERSDCQNGRNISDAQKWKIIK